MMNPGRHRGWYQVAFERDLIGDLTPATIGSDRLVLVRTKEGLRCFLAVCPHRGADLGLGCLSGSFLVCPFHGFRIGLDSLGDQGFRACEFAILLWGGMVFARLMEAHENGLSAFLREQYPGHCFVPGFELATRAPAELIIENGFDAAHFRTVHGINNEPEFTITRGPGPLIARGVFEIGTTHSYRMRTGANIVRVSYSAHAFSGGLIISDLGGENPYSVVTAATPTRDGGCVIRVSLILPPGDDHVVARSKYLLEQSRLGLEKDRGILESLSLNGPFRATDRDHPVIEFREFCRDLAGKSVSEEG